MCELSISDISDICQTWRITISSLSTTCDTKMFSLWSLPSMNIHIQQVGFTLSHATKALRESRGIALLYFRPLH